MSIRIILTWSKMPSVACWIVKGAVSSPNAWAFLFPGMVFTRLYDLIICTDTSIR